MSIVAFAPDRRGCTPYPAAFPTFSDDPDVEAAIEEARACLWPASDGYKRNMAAIADRAERTARLVADLGDVESDPALWPGWTDGDRWTTAEPRTRARNDWTDADQLRHHGCV